MQGGFFYFQDRYLLQDYWGIAGIAVKWDLDCGQTKHRARAIARRACAVRARRADLESQIALQVRQTFLEVQTANERVEATKAAVDQSNDNLNGTINRYRNALATNTEVLDAVTLRLALPPTITTRCTTPSWQCSACGER